MHSGRLGCELKGMMKNLQKDAWRCFTSLERRWSRRTRTILNRPAPISRNAAGRRVPMGRAGNWQSRFWTRFWKGPSAFVTPDQRRSRAESAATTPTMTCAPRTPFHPAILRALGSLTSTRRWVYTHDHHDTSPTREVERKDSHQSLWTYEATVTEGLVSLEFARRVAAST